jgi:allantoate deiminase
MCPQEKHSYLDRQRDVHSKLAISAASTFRVAYRNQTQMRLSVFRGSIGHKVSRLELTGEANHAGAFPMDSRRDPMAGFAEIASGVISTAERWGRPAVTTVGQVRVEPNLPAIIPAKVAFMIDARHPDPEALQRLYALHENLIHETADRRGLNVKLTVVEDQAPLTCHPEIVTAIESAAEAQGIPFGALSSGGSHDTQQMSKLARAGMIFVRSKDCRSHTPEEFSSIADIVASIRVLAGTLYRLAYS